MVKITLPKVQAFYEGNMPIGDRLGEMFYAVWMVVVTLGILGATELEQWDLFYVIFLAFGVNTTWGLIDGITVMYTHVIDRARSDKVIYDLRANRSGIADERAKSALDDSITVGLGEEDRRTVLELIAAGEPNSDPSKKRYRPGKEDWHYALGILSIDVLMVIPLVAPLLIWSDPKLAIFISRGIATIIFSMLGVAYARNLNGRPWLAALTLGALGFTISTLAYLAGW